MKEYFPENGLPILKNWISSHFFRKNEAATVATTGDYADLSGTDNVATKNYVEDKIDDIEVGGTNLLTGSRDFTGAWIGIDGGNNEFTNEKYLGFSVVRSRKRYIGARQEYTVSEIGEYTFSCYVRKHGEAEVTIYAGNETEGNMSPAKKILSGIDSSFKKVAFTFYVTVPGSKIYPRPENTSANANATDNYIEFCGYKLERGTVATDWSPAPEDVDAKINSIEIGGRNYFGFNKKATTRKYYPDLKSEELIITYDPSIKGYTIKANKEFAGGKWHYFGVYRFGLQKLGKYTVSMDITSTNDTTAFLVFCDIHTENIPLKAGITTHLSYTFDTTNKQVAVLDFGGILDYHVAENSVLPADTTISFSNVKVELGNKATDWTPAPEDLQSAMFDANGNVKLSTEDLRKLASALKTYLQ